MEEPVVTKIKDKFNQIGNPAKIPLMNGKQFFEARLEEDGIYVDNLRNQPFLPWEIFSEAINCLKENGGQAKKGNATNSRLGDSNLDLNTMEGYIASKVYGCKTGDLVFKRMTPIASILSWAEICENKRGQIYLLSLKEEIPFLKGKGEVSLASFIERDKASLEESSFPPQLESKDIELEKLKTQLSGHLEKIKEFEKQLESSHEEMNSLEETINDYENQLSHKEEAIKNLENQIVLMGKVTENLETQIIHKNGYTEELKTQLNEKEYSIKIFETKINGKDSEIRALLEKLAVKTFEIEKLESELTEQKKEKNRLNTDLKERGEGIRALEGKLSEKEDEIKELKESISIKDRDLKTLAGEVMAKVGEVRKIEEKLTVKERKINTIEVMLVTSEEKVKTLEKQLSGYKGEENLAVQLREKEELIKQLKGTLASKEEEFSRLNEENRKFKRQQKMESDGLRQIEEQKASRKWWKRL
jgi:chromosome segregation ATPase